jgi:hypothetical protein
MESVTFVFRPGLTSEQQDAILERLQSWTAIDKAERLNRTSSNPDISRMAYAYVSDEAEPRAIAQRLSEIPEIESATLPAPRRLVP